MIDEFAVREVGGVTGLKTKTHEEVASVRILEQQDCIHVVIARSQSSSNPPQLTIDAARSLARMLYRMARRIEQRNAA